MINFIDLSSDVRSVLCSVAILLMIGFVVNTIQGVIQRRKAYVIESTVEFFVPYFIFHICAEVSDYYLGGELDNVASIFAKLPFLVYIIVYVLLAILGCIRFFKGVNYRKNHITPSAIKEAADKMSTGFCYYNQNGHPFLTNSIMNEIAVAITGKSISNGIAFAQIVTQENIKEINGVVYHFTTREVINDKEPFFEILADDVTEMYKKTQELKASNDLLRVNNAKMKVYGQHINETVRREEILKSKVKIHNEMNKLLLQTDNAINIKSAKDRQKVLDTWLKNAIVLCKEANETEENPLGDLYELAKLIGITIHIDKDPKLDSIETLRLFVNVAEEAMANAVKHASAKNFYIDTNETSTNFSAIFTNDGLSPANDVKESGGLKELRRKIEKANGTMTIESNPFALSISITIN